MQSGSQDQNSQDSVTLIGAYFYMVLRVGYILYYSLVVGTRYFVVPTVASEQLLLALVSRYKFELSAYLFLLKQKIMLMRVTVFRLFFGWTIARLHTSLYARRGVEHDKYYYLGVFLLLLALQCIGRVLSPICFVIVECTTMHITIC